MTRDADRGRADAGVTLVELIVYLMALGLVLASVTMILVNSWRTQESVLSETEATNRGQLVSASIERAVRNGLAVEVLGGSSLRVHTSLTGNRACQGFDLSGTTARMIMNDGPLGTAWPEWEKGITAVPGKPLLEGDGTTVSYAFQIETTAAPVLFEGTVAARNPTGVTSPCWP